MTIFEVLTVLTFVISTMTMFMVFVSVLPHMKEGMTMVRDAILWAALVIVVVAALYFGWAQLSGKFQKAPDFGDDEYAAYQP